jgi:translation initiation factor IF-2
MVAAGGVIPTREPSRTLRRPGAVIVANKIDKPGADPEKITRELPALASPRWGGETISRRCRRILPEHRALLESILPRLRCSAQRNEVLAATVIRRCRLHRAVARDGEDGTPGRAISSGWRRVGSAGAQLAGGARDAGRGAGLNEVPSAGDPAHAVDDGKTAEEIAETRRKKTSKTPIQDWRVISRA